MRSLKIIVFICSLSLWGGVAQAANPEGRLAQAAFSMGREMDRQLAEKMGQDTPVMGVSLASTTPVDVNDLEKSNALARQMQEELTRWFVQSGYSVQELRKGKSVLVNPEQGELLLTRKMDLLASKKVRTNLVLAGTYTLAGKNIRFNMRLIDTMTEEVYAMSNATVSLTADLRALLGDLYLHGGGMVYNFEPSVFTRLP